MLEERVAARELLYGPGKRAGSLSQQKASARLTRQQRATLDARQEEIFWFVEV